MMEDIGYINYYNYFLEHKKEILDKYKAIKGSLPVLAIVDGDYDAFDEDLKDRMWKNPQEDPYNSEDDDGNGWVNDYGIMNFIDKWVYPASGGRSDLTEQMGRNVIWDSISTNKPIFKQPRLPWPLYGAFSWCKAGQ